jgi:predicted ferric reductase
MNSHFWWYVSRASGTVAWVLVLATCAWGILLATRLFRGWDRPAWLLDLHRWLGSLLVASTALHMVALIGDNYTHFTAAHLLVPFVSDWEPGSVALGVVAFWMLAAVQVTSMMMKKLPKKWWRGIHMLSYLAFAMVTWHAIAAGTDASSRWYAALTVTVIALASAFGIARLITMRTPTTRTNTRTARSMRDAAAQPAPREG